MAVSIVMPALELAQETGKIVSWLKKEGDRITKGEPILEIETDKAVVEIEAPADGVLAGVKSREGSVVPVGRTIAWVVAPGEQPPEEKSSDGGVRISPKARRLAKERGIDISQIRGTGPDGTISSEDILAAAAPPVPQTVETPALSSIARLMAERTTQSWTQVPHFFLVREIDAGALNEARDRGVQVTHTDLLVALVARVLAKHPKMNASWVGGAVRLNPSVNISIAMAVKDGVVGAVIPNAGTTSLAEIAAQRRDLTERARAGRLRPRDVAGGTFTITNLGMYNIDAFSAIILPPQAAILAIGRIADRVVPVDGKPGIRPMMTVTLSVDHRVVDGAQAALFLNDLADAILEPQKWLQ